MTQTRLAEGTDTARSALRCPHLPPLSLVPGGPSRIHGRVAGFILLRRGLLTLAALALPALGALLADPVHRARSSQATQAAAAPRPPLDGAAAAFIELRGARIVLSARETSDPAGRP